MRDDLRRQVVLVFVAGAGLGFCGGWAPALPYTGGAGMLQAGFAAACRFLPCCLALPITPDEAAFREPEFHGIVEAAPG